MALGLSVVCVGLVAVAAYTRRGEPSAPGADAEPRATVEATEGEPALVMPSIDAAGARWIAIGGGSEPGSNQISLEDDLLLVAEVLGERGLVLFSGGSGTRSVQVLAEHERGDPLRARLGDLLAPRGARDARFVAARMTAQGGSRRETVQAALYEAMRAPGAPLAVWIASHGDRGESPHQARVLLWAGGSIGPIDLLDLAAKAGPTRPIRFVIGACYSGGFAELAFDELDPERGPTPFPMCGLFATSWDREASGCDPSPDRAAQEGYAIHVLHALRGQDREGGDARSEIDLDGDGRITLLEAHARARAVAVSIDVPTTTSVRLLEALAPADGPSIEIELPEERAVLDAIGARLSIGTDDEARERLEDIERRREELDGAYLEVESELDRRWWNVWSELMSRWPELEDPWHPDFEPILASERESIERFLATSSDYARWMELSEDLSAMDHTLAGLDVEAAPILRWLEAAQALARAGRLAAIGGPIWERYQRMRECESSVP